MQIEIKGYALYIEDNYGNNWSALVTDMTDAVSVYGLLPAKPKLHMSFESEAYHLSAFAKAEGLKYVSKEVTVAIEV